EDRPEVVERAAQGDQDIGVCLAHRPQIAGDGSWGDEEDAIGAVFSGEQGCLTEGLLAQVEDSSLAKAGWSVLLKHEVVDLVAMEGETDGLLVTIRDGLASRLIRGDGDEGDLPWRGLGGLGGEEGKVDLFDDVEDGFGLEGGAVESLLDLGGE